MAKSAKKVEKETRKLLEGTNDIIKKKNGRFKFKIKGKKQIRAAKQRCFHWIIRKNKEVPLVRSDIGPSGYWKCTLCGKVFPIRPKELDTYINDAEQFMQDVEQMAFWSVRMGGDKEDTKMFLALKANVPRFLKASKNILKEVNKRDAWDKNRQKTDLLSQFDAYSGYSYAQV